MKATTFHEYNNSELSNQLIDLKKKLFNLRFEHATGQLKNGNQLADIKKDIARVKTILRERELGISSEPVKKAKKAK